MNLWKTSLLLLAGVVAVSGDDGEPNGEGPGGEDTQENHSPGYRSEGQLYRQPGQAPVHHAAAGHGPYRGGPRGGYAYPPPPPPVVYNPGYYPYGGGYGAPQQDKGQDELDELYARLDVVQTILKTESESLGSLEARLSLEKKAVDQFYLVDLPAAQQTDHNQDIALDRLMQELTDLNQKVTDLETLMSSIEVVNSQNLKYQQISQTTMAIETTTDIDQEGLIAGLLDSVRDLKEKLLQVMTNQYGLMDTKIEGGKDYLNIIKDKETDRMCEVGQVTLDVDDRKAEYLFQTGFQYVPQLLYSICGYNFDLNAIEDPKHGYRRTYGSYGGYRGGDGDGYGYSRPPPDTLGVTVTGSMVSKTGVTFEAVDLSFGDMTLQTVDVCFQACSVGPGNDLASSRSIFSGYAERW